jgi:hypothetical protein
MILWNCWNLAKKRRTKTNEIYSLPLLVGWLYVSHLFNSLLLYYHFTYSQYASLRNCYIEMTYVQYFSTCTSWLNAQVTRVETTAVLMLKFVRTRYVVNIDLAIQTNSVLITTFELVGTGCTDSLDAMHSRPWHNGLDRFVVSELLLLIISPWRAVLCSGNLVSVIIAVESVDVKPKHPTPNAQHHYWVASLLNSQQ